MSTLRFPWEEPEAAAQPETEPETRPPRRRGRRPTVRIAAEATAAAWQACRLTVRGPDEDRAAFLAAAEGSGITPWQEDEAAWEEDAFYRALAVPAARRGLSLPGCRQLARQYREAVAAHRARAAAWGQSPVGRQACPLDLHRVLPVPDALLARGSADREALAWCRAQWGVIQIRRVERQVAADTLSYRFWALGGTGLRRERLARLWPALRFL